MKKKINKKSALRLLALTTLFGSTLIGSNYSFSTTTFAADEAGTNIGYTSVIEDLTKLQLISDSYKTNQVIDFQEYYDFDSDTLKYFVYIYYDGCAAAMAKKIAGDLSLSYRKVRSSFTNTILEGDEGKEYELQLISNQDNYFKYELVGNIDNFKIYDDDTKERKYVISDIKYNYVITGSNSNGDHKVVNYTYSFSDQDIHFKRTFFSNGDYGSQEIEILEDKICTITDKAILASTLGAEDKVHAFFGQHGDMSEYNRYIDNWFVCFNTSIDDDINSLKSVTLNYLEYKFDLNFGPASEWSYPRNYHIYGKDFDKILKMNCYPTASEIEAWHDVIYSYDSMSITLTNGTSSYGGEGIYIRNHAYDKIAHEYVTIAEGTHEVMTSYVSSSGDTEYYYTEIDNILDLNEVSKTGIPVDNPDEYIDLSEQAEQYHWAVNFANTIRYFDNKSDSGAHLVGSTCNSGVEILKLTYQDKRTGKVLTARVTDEPTSLDEPIIEIPDVNVIPRVKPWWEQIGDFFSSIGNWFKQAWAWIVGIGLAIVGLILLSLVIKFVSPVFKSLSTAKEIKKAKKAEKKKQMISNLDDKQIIININGDEKFHSRKKKGVNDNGIH